MALLFDLSAGGGDHGVAQTEAPRCCAALAMAISPAAVVPSGAMRTRSSESPAPAVTEKRVSASAALAKPPSHADEAPKPEIDWCAVAGLTTMSPERLDPAGLDA